MKADLDVLKKENQDLKEKQEISEATLLSKVT